MKESKCGTFEPGILRREGGHVYEGVSGTLRANAGDNQMTVYVCSEDLITAGEEKENISIDTFQ